MSKMTYGWERQWLLLVRSRRADFATKDLHTAWLVTHRRVPIRKPLRGPKRRKQPKASEVSRTEHRSRLRNWLWSCSYESEPLLSLFVNSSRQRCSLTSTWKSKLSQRVRTKVWSSNSIMPKTPALSFLVGCTFPNFLKEHSEGTTNNWCAPLCRIFTAATERSRWAEQAVPAWALAQSASRWMVQSASRCMSQGRLAWRGVGNKQSILYTLWSNYGKRAQNQAGHT